MPLLSSACAVSASACARSRLPSAALLMSPRRLAVITLLAFLAMAAPASRAERSLLPPVAADLNTGWEIAYDPDNQGLEERYQTGRWDQDWRDVEVPHVFNAKPVDDQFLGTIAWYRLKLTTPTAPDGFNWALRFEGVAPARDGLPERPPHRRLAEGLRAVHDPAAAPARARPRERARGARVQPALGGPARGLVELGRPHAPGRARADRQGHVGRPRHPLRRPLRGRRQGLPPDRARRRLGAEPLGPDRRRPGRRRADRAGRDGLAGRARP